MSVLLTSLYLAILVASLGSVLGTKARTMPLVGLYHQTLLPLSVFVAGCKPATPEFIRVSEGIQAARLMKKVAPVYPPLARQARIAGVVKLEAIIARDGSVRKLQATSGHPLLIPAAKEAVSHWRYHPTLLNGEPVEVFTQIEVRFVLR